MSSVLDQAQNFSGGVVAAARKREGWLRRAANATDPETAEQYREAAADLAARYPDIEDLEIGEAEKFARDRGHGRGSRTPTHEGRSRSRPGTTRRRSTPSTPSSSKPKKSTSRRARAAAPAAQPTPRVDSAIKETGIPAALGSGQSIVLGALGGTIGLSLLYLLVSSAESPGSGGAALPKAIGFVSGAVGRFLGLNDFFPSNDPVREKFTVRHAGGGKPTVARYAGPSTVKKAAERLKAMEANQKAHR